MNPAGPGPEERATPVGPRGRLWVFATALVGAFAIVVVALARTQLGRSEELRTRDERQTLRRVPLPAPRGALLDREGRELAVSVPRVDAVVLTGTGRQAQDRLASLRTHHARIQARLGRNEAFDEERAIRQLRHDRLAPFVLAADLDPSEVRLLETGRDGGGAVTLRTRWERAYPHGPLAAHVIGRLRREMRAPGRVPGNPALASTRFMDTTGDSGLELREEDSLAGRPGVEVVRVDAGGYPVEGVGPQVEPEAGADLRLSLDLDLQRAADAAMAATPGGGRGAAVVLDVRTGEVLALVSRPDFDLNDVSPSMTAATKARIDGEGGWFNRATQGLYPPGSTFKIYTMIAGLRGGTLDPYARLACPGHLDVGGHRFVCHNPEGHGAPPLRTALAQSCNVFAYRTGLAAGPEALSTEARRFHFDRPTAIDLPGETGRMLVPDARWKAETGRGAWLARDTINLAIGQGDLRISPLQAAAALASLARRETLTVPTLRFSPGRDPAGGHPREPLDLSDRDYTALIEGLQAVVDAGIGQRAKVPGVTMAGKTGTAQIETPFGMTNVAWYLAFAPIEKPAIAVAVALEAPEAGEEFAGAEFAAPVVHAVVAAYVDKHPAR